MCQGREAVMREHIGTRKTGRLRSDRVTEQRDDRKRGAGKKLREELETWGKSWSAPNRPAGIKHQPHVSL